MALPSLGNGLAIFGAGVAPSFSWVGLALPVGLAIPSLGVGVGPSGPSGRVDPSFPWVRVGIFSGGEGWPFGSGLARPRSKRGKGQALPKSGEWEGKGPSQKERKVRGQARPKIKGGLKLGLALPSWGRGWPLLLGCWGCPALCGCNLI